MDKAKYQKFNQLLSERQISSEEFLVSLQQFKTSLFAYNLPTHSDQPIFEQYARIAANDRAFESFGMSSLEKGDILSQTEDAVFKEVIGLQIQSNRIQAQIQKQKRLYDKQYWQLQQQQQNPGLIISEEVRRQEKLLFKRQQIDKIKEEIDDIQRKIEVISILDDDIDAKIQQLKLKSQELDLQKQQMRNKIDQKKYFTESKNRDRGVVIGSFSRREEEQVDGEEIIDMLKDRLQLQARIKSDSDEKQEFIELLMGFKEQYDQAIQKNIELKSQHHQKTFSLPS